MRRLRWQNLKLQKSELKYFFTPFFAVSLLIAMFVGFVYVEKNTKKIAFDDVTPVFKFMNMETQNANFLSNGIDQRFQRIKNKIIDSDIYLKFLNLRKNFTEKLSSLSNLSLIREILVNLHHIDETVINLLFKQKLFNTTNQIIVIQ